MAIKSFTDTYKIKGSDIDRFCRIMSDTKKIKIQITNDHQIGRASCRERV